MTDEKKEQAKAVLDEGRRAEPNWRELARRLAAALGANWTYLRDGSSGNVAIAREALDEARKAGILR